MRNTANLSDVRSRLRPDLALLLGVHIVACCLSLVYVMKFYWYFQIAAFDPSRLFASTLTVALFAIVAVVFAFGRFSFGYLLAFYFYGMIAGYLWLVDFATSHYDHRLGAASAFVSAVAFILPALFISPPVRLWPVLSERALDRLLVLILILAAAIIGFGAFANFRLVGVGQVYNFRDAIAFPAWLRYALGATSNALLPFAFACYATRGKRWRAALALLLMLLFYPITLNRLALFAPFWLLYLAALSRLFEARTSVVLSFFLPLAAGLFLVLLFQADVLSYQQMIAYFGNVNFRMIALPSIVLDLYNDFFSTHPRTWFCQIQFLKPFVGCPYNEYLSIVMAKAYQLGNMNGSLFATEGIASVGPVAAPLVAFACGLVISLANSLSAGLPPRFILLSGGLMALVFLNVPLSTTLLSNGAGLLFLLWYVTPRAMFEPGADAPIEPAK
jgi:hypothetical protein